MNANPPTANLGRILIIDDETGILITLKKILLTAGYEAETAASGRAGLDLFAQGSWDAVIVDRSMPEMNGEQVAAEIKRLSPPLPIILITGFPGAVTRHELFHAILGKPFRPTALLQCLTDALPRRSEESGDEGANSTKSDCPAILPKCGSPGGNRPAEALPSWKTLLKKPCLRPA